MRVLFLLTLSCCFYSASAQLPWNYPGAGIRMQQMIADSIARIPSDTTINKTGIARIGTTLYVGNGVRWTAAGGTSIDTSLLATKQALNDTAAAIRLDIPSAPTQLLFGGIVTTINDSLFSISPANYRINGSVYNAPDTIIEIGNYTGLPRIDLFYADTGSKFKLRAGTPNANPVSPSTNANELAIGFVLIDSSGGTITPTAPTLWVQTGADIQNINAGDVITPYQMRAAAGFNVNTSGAFTGFKIGPSGGNVFDLQAGNNTIMRGTLLGSSLTGSFINMPLSVAPVSGSGTTNFMRVAGTITSSGANSRDYNQLAIQPQYVQGAFGTGNLTGVYYNPTVTSLNTSNHYAWWSTSGGIRAQGLSTVDSTYGLPLVIDANGNFAKANKWYGGGGGGGGGSYTFEDGLTEAAGVVKLGGATDESILITSSGLNSFEVDGFGDKILLKTSVDGDIVLQSDGTSEAQIQLQTENLYWNTPAANLVYNGDTTGKFALVYDNLGNPGKIQLRPLGEFGGVTQQQLDDTAAAIRNYTTENIRYVAGDSGVVMTVVGDTAKFAVDTNYIRRKTLGYKELIIKVRFGLDTAQPTIVRVLKNTLGFMPTFNQSNVIGIYRFENGTFTGASAGFDSKWEIHADVFLGTVDNNLDGIVIQPIYQDWDDTTLKFHTHAIVKKEVAGFEDAEPEAVIKIIKYD